MKIDKITTDDDLIDFLLDQHKQTCNQKFMTVVHTLERYRRCNEILSWQLSEYAWISVDERLPAIDPCGKGRYGGTRSVRVLCACKQRDGKTFVKEGYYEPCGNGHVVWRIPGSIDSVTHWMPLPEPPIEKEN